MEVGHGFLLSSGSPRLCSPSSPPGEVQRPYCPLQVDLHGDAVAANQQIRLRHHEPGRQPDQTGRTCVPTSCQCPLVLEQMSSWPRLGGVDGQLLTHQLRGGGLVVRALLSSELRVATHQLPPSQLLGVVGLSDCCLSSTRAWCRLCSHFAGFASSQTGLHVSCFLQFSPSCLLPSLV